MSKKERFFSHGVWRIRTEDLSKPKALGIRLLRILLLIGEGFTKSQVQVGAASLTFYSLLSTVPILTFFFGLARGFLLEKPFREWLIQRFDEQKVIVGQIAQLAQQSIAQGKEGVIIGSGLVLLLWAGIRILNHLEIAMNNIWEMRSGRSFARRFSDYLALFFICPIFVLISMSLTAFFTGSTDPILQFLSPLLNLIPVLLLWVLFTFIYIFIPNVRVNFMSAFWAGMITAIIYQLVQWFYIYFQVGASHYSAVFGTLAALPLFLVWLYVSWIIVLMGAKITFAFQNVSAYEFMTEDIHLSHHFRHVLALRITHLCVKRFMKEEAPPTYVEISNLLAIPLPLVSRLVRHLLDSGVLVEVRRRDPGFQPAKNIENLTIKSVLDMISFKGEEIPLPEGDDVEKILEYFDAEAKMSESPANLKLKDF
ncbi:MAG: YihY/virulence factor BrkB family protein [Chlamydiales bacterium]|nr:YihY/virulence factor BrkB family protein [Chlamydiales bacterium]